MAPCQLGGLPDGTAKLLCVPLTPLLSFLVDGKDLKGRECAGKHALGCPPAGSPGGSGTPTHVLQQRLLPHGLHQAFGVHVAQAQDVEGPTVFAGRAKQREGTLFRGDSRSSCLMGKEVPGCAHHRPDLSTYLLISYLLPSWVGTNHDKRNSAYKYDFTP